ncbi:MAG: arginine repressor [bacterium]|nr:arginine repressor [Candidatus Kapabacteria bacterium]
MNKQGRHFTIRQIIATRAVANQDELRQILEAEGIEITQASLSRDLKELGIARAHTADGMRYVLESAGEENRLASLIALEIEWIESNESLIIVRTLAGRASGVAEIIDGFRHPDIIGTLAGDNTIFIAPRSTKRIAAIVEELRKIVGSQ